MKHNIFHILLIKFFFVTACVLHDNSATTDDIPNIKDPQDGIMSSIGASDEATMDEDGLVTLDIELLSYDRPVNYLSYEL